MCSRIKFTILIRLLPSVMGNWMSSVCLCTSDGRLKDVKRLTVRQSWLLKEKQRQKWVSFSLCGHGVWRDTLQISLEHGPVLLDSQSCSHSVPQSLSFSADWLWIWPRHTLALSTGPRQTSPHSWALKCLNHSWAEAGAHLRDGRWNYSLLEKRITNPHFLQLNPTRSASL